REHGYAISPGRRRIYVAGGFPRGVPRKIGPVARVKRKRTRGRRRRIHGLIPDFATAPSGLRVPTAPVRADASRHHRSAPPRPQQALPHANQAGASRPPPPERVLAADGVAGPGRWWDGDCRRRTAPPTARLAAPLGPAVQAP